jgi:uncharacterized protein
MPVALLDVNVLLALAWPNHGFHRQAHHWFARQRSLGWATCPFTQAGFVRISMQPAIVANPISAAAAIGVLKEATQDRYHVFWLQDRGAWQIAPPVLAQIAGHRQVTDAMLLDLAIQRSGRLATFDRRLEPLAARSGHTDVLEMIPL